LIHNGATSATKLERCNAKGEQQGLLSSVGAAPDGPFATANFAEFIFMRSSSMELPLIGFLRSSATS
jgi:hypothetical protein